MVPANNRKTFLIPELVRERGCPGIMLLRYELLRTLGLHFEIQVRKKIDEKPHGEVCMCLA